MQDKHHVGVAAREEHNPFPLAVFLPGYGRAFAFVRWTSYSCPSCGRTYRRDYWTDSVHIGPKIQACSNCGSQFDCGSREWPEIPTFRKVRVFFPPLLVGISGGLVLAGILVSTVPPFEWLVIIASAMIALMPIILWYILRLPWVLLSIRRYRANARASSK